MELHPDIVAAITEDAKWTEIGRVRTTEGRIASCDPLYLFKDEHSSGFSLSDHLIADQSFGVGPGDYAVRSLSLDGQRAAVALILDDLLPTTDWMHLRPHPIESGYSCFACYDNALTCKNAGEQAKWQAKPEGTHDIGEGSFVSFDTRYGDGLYELYFGLNFESHASMIINDLLTIPIG